MKHAVRFFSLLLAVILLISDIQPVYAEEYFQEITVDDKVFASGIIQQESGFVSWVLYESGKLDQFFSGVVFMPDNTIWEAYGDRITDVEARMEDNVWILPESPCEHDPIWETIEPATPISDGIDRFTCKKCGYTYEAPTVYGDGETGEDAYALVAQVDGETIYIPLNSEDLEKITLQVGIEYNLVKLYKKFHPIKSIKVSKLLKLIRKIVGRSAVNMEASGTTEMCTFCPQEPGTAVIQIEYADDTTRTMEFSVAGDPVTQPEETTPPSGEGDEPETSEKTETPAEPELPPVGTTFTVGKGKYKITTKGSSVSFTGISGSKVKTFSVPDTVRYKDVSYNVTSVASKAFYNQTSMTSVTIGNNVKSIGSYAFYKDKKLKTIRIHTTKLTSSSIGKYAFKSIYSKAKIYVPKKKKTSYRTWMRKKGLSSKAKVYGSY